MEKGRGTALFAKSTIVLSVVVFFVNGDKKEEKEEKKSSCTALFWQLKWSSFPSILFLFFFLKKQTKIITIMGTNGQSNGAYDWIEEHQ